jgi:hypothetical protein
MTGRWQDFDGGAHGGLRELLAMAGEDFICAPRESPQEARQRLAKRAADAQYHRAVARRLWADGEPIGATLGEAYFRQGRAIRAPLGPHLRFLGACPVNFYSKAPVAFMPAVLAHVVDHHGHGLGLRLTFLSPGGLSRTGHRMVASVDGGVIWLIESRTGRWVIGEGVETTLSLWDHLNDPEAGAVCALSASGLGGFEPRRWAQTKIIELLIAEDPDAAGEREAGRLAERCERIGLPVVQMRPPKGMGDWNDHAQAGAKTKSMTTGGM